MVSSAKPCVRCSTPVCNACRFHMDYTVVKATRRPSLLSKKLLWCKDEHRLASERRSPFSFSWFAHQYGSFDRQFLQEPTEDLMANNWRVYCSEHLLRYTQDMIPYLNQDVDGPTLCQCDPVERYVGNWLCVPCFMAETQTCIRGRDQQLCADCLPPRRQYGDLRWKLCMWCKKRVKPWMPGLDG